MVPASAPFTYLIHCLKTFCSLKSRSLSLARPGCDGAHQAMLVRDRLSFEQDNLILTKPALATCINTISVFVPWESRPFTIASETFCHRVSCVELWQRIDVRMSRNSPYRFTLSNSWKTPFSLLAESCLSVRRASTITSFSRSAFDKSLGLKCLCMQHTNSFDFDMSMSCTKQSRHVTLSNDRAISQPRKRAPEQRQQWPP